MASTIDPTAPVNQNYTIFEGSSIKQFIVDQLNKGGIFIDQQYLGSNLNAFIDIIAVMLQQLQFHYSNTATESTFATASLFENMNKLVSLFNYKPSGKQTSILPVSISSRLSEAGKTGTFLIPRYSFLTYNKSFFLRKDITFSSLSNEETNIEDIMYQGSLTESEKFYISGEDFQTITLIDQNINTTDKKFISDNFFDVYVREPGGKWIQYQEVNSLFDVRGNDKAFERRLNENFNYDFKFGNNINGYKPVDNSEVIIFYVISDGANAQVGDNMITNTSLYLYNSTNFQEIILDTQTGIFETLPAYIVPEDLKYFSISNTSYSTAVTSVETVDLMRNNVPKLFVSQNRLLSQADYLNYILKYFNNFVRDCYVFNNNEYTSSFLNYFYNIGLNAPNEDSRVLLNQVTFQSSCAFNNIYLVLLPLVNTIIEDKIPNYVNSNLKQYIIEQISSIKDLAHSIAPIDPIYKAVSFGILGNENLSLVKDFDSTKLVLLRDKYSNFNSDYITSQAVTIFKDFFNNIKLGSTIDISYLSAQLIQIPGVTGLKMDNGVSSSDKLTFIVWNPLYEESDFSITQQNTALSPFMFPYFYDLKNINSKIIVINE